MEINDIKKVVEALLFVSDKPLLTREIRAVIKDDLPENVKLEDILQQMQQEYVQLDRAFELKFVADGWTFATKPQYSSWIKVLLKERTILKLSPSAMEVLAIIAYKQPITRAEIGNIRGVDPGSIIDTLTDRKFIKIVGRKETLGRPLLYGTTQDFLRHFGLSHLSELPVIENENDLFSEKKEEVQEMLFDNQANFASPSSVISSEESQSDSDERSVAEQPNEGSSEEQLEISNEQLAINNETISENDANSQPSDLGSQQTPAISEDSKEENNPETQN
ncbi:MAG: SMC-Scp complex subunit ScpB [Elusimicrobia bacterium]|nr:SMC-Scp complex subunit ScpB [Elusimicrobiota bacterium]